MKFLIAEDDEHTRAGLCEIVENEGHQPLPAADGDEALAVFHREKPDFVCLDIMMPGQDGYSLCREIRRLDQRVPIVFISAKSEEVDTVLGLELGADDFIVKPFGVREVAARIRAITRRRLAWEADNVGHATQAFRVMDLEVFPSELRAVRGEERIDLSLRDVRILELFYLNPGRVLGRDEIFNHVWGVDYFPNSRTLDQHISQLRKRIEVDPRHPRIIVTVHGAGYRFQEDEAESSD